MPRRTLTFDTVREIALAMPGVEVGTMYGQPALKLRGQLLACTPAHRSAEPGSLVLRLDFADRAELLAGDPSSYYITEHYRNYPAVLVRMARMNSSQLKDLLTMAYKFVGAKSKAAPRSKKRR
jgi:hypothetical protein